MIGIITAIAFIGVMMLYSAAEGDLSPWGYKQIIRFIAGLFIMIAVSLVDIRTIFSLSYPFYVLSLLFLFGVEVIGFIGKGGQRWLDLYIFNLQPSELMKVALILSLARYFHTCSLQDIGKVKYLLVPSLMVLVPVLLVLRQPDLGTAMMLLMAGAILFFLTGVKWWKFAVVGGSLLSFIPIFWNFLRDYQKNRILIFLNPEQDPSNAGYHVTQSKIAIGSGGIFGKGWMEGTQSHLNFLPEKQTDFIFTMFSEEFGLIGGCILLLLYSLIIMYGFKVALTSRNHFGRLVALGMSSILFLYVFINIAMVMGLVPVVGVPLPLMSYGGTALLTLMLGQGLIFSVKVYQDVRIGR
ncbi:MAG: rod shape-determining protein RodA [Proteobacteria bacterium]|nr:rod shape-determining protein RodA [Pseudomonadota bacterium]